MVLYFPQVSAFEGHPYTLTSAPSDNYFEVHIRGLGVYTNRLIARAYRKGTKTLQAAVEGPYGSLDMAYPTTPVHFLVAGGIGTRRVAHTAMRHGPA